MRFVVGILCLAVAACAVPWHGPLWVEADHGEQTLHWQPISPPTGATELTYEVAVYAAAQGLPRERVFTRGDLVATRLVLEPQSKGDYVFSVRAHFVRDGLSWVSRWATTSLLAPSALIPARGYCALAVAR